VQVPKFGEVETSKMLFIGSGAFLISKPSNLLAELQVCSTLSDSSFFISHVLGSIADSCQIDELDRRRPVSHYD
jgi:hypothetical protein